MSDQNGETKSRLNEFFWIASGAAILLILGLLFSGKNIASSIGHTVGYNIVSIAMTVGLFFLTDFLPNKIIARSLFVIGFLGIVYWWYFAAR